MPLFTHAPRPPLNEFVDYLWLFQDGEARRKERILPSGTIELVVNLDEDNVRIHDPANLERYTRFSGAVVSGAYARPFVCDADAAAVRKNPAAGTACLSMSRIFPLRPKSSRKRVTLPQSDGGWAGRQVEDPDGNPIELFEPAG